MSLSKSALRRLATALSSTTEGNEVASDINTALALAVQSTWSLAAVITATGTSTTTDFGALAVGDKVLILPASAGNAQFVSCATKGTLPQAAVSGSLYVVLRAFTAPAAAAFKF